jgi:hypothetical protein
MGYFTKEAALTVNYTNHRHFGLHLGMEWIGPKWANSFFKEHIQDLSLQKG